MLVGLGWSGLARASLLLFLSCWLVGKLNEGRRARGARGNNISSALAPEQPEQMDDVGWGEGKEERRER